MRRLGMAFLVLGLTVGGVTRSTAQTGGSVVIYGGKLLTITHGEISKGSILIVNGKIKEIGEKVGLTRERVRQIENEALTKLGESMQTG